MGYFSNLMAQTGFTFPMDAGMGAGTGPAPETPSAFEQRTGPGPLHREATELDPHAPHDARAKEARVENEVPPGKPRFESLVVTGSEELVAEPDQSRAVREPSSPITEASSRGEAIQTEIEETTAGAGFSMFAKSIPSPEDKIPPEEQPRPLVAGNIADAFSEARTVAQTEGGPGQTPAFFDDSPGHVKPRLLRDTGPEKQAPRESAMPGLKKAAMTIAESRTTAEGKESFEEQAGPANNAESLRGEKRFALLKEVGKWVAEKPESPPPRTHEAASPEMAKPAPVRAHTATSSKRADPESPPARAHTATSAIKANPESPPARAYTAANPEKTKPASARDHRVTSPERANPDSPPPREHSVTSLERANKNTPVTIPKPRHSENADVHLSIGSIHLTVEEPQPKVSRSKPTRKQEAPRPVSSRLRRRYIH